MAPHQDRDQRQPTHGEPTPVFSQSDVIMREMARRTTVRTLPGHQTECCRGSCGQSIDRREFLQIAGSAVSASWALQSMAIAGPFESADGVEHFVPADKKLSSDWIQALFDIGTRTWYTQNDLDTIGMPIGGICTGQLYLTGDGRLVLWDIFNQDLNTGYGQVNYKVGRQPTERVKTRQFIEDAPDVDQGFAVRVQSEGKSAVTRRLDRTGFPGVRFCGEYPIGYVDYSDPTLPVQVTLEAFSPFIPLNANDSSLPATVLHFSLKNTSQQPMDVTLAGWLENTVGRQSEAAGLAGERINQIRHPADCTQLLCRVEEVAKPKPPRPPIVFADFEGGSYGDWQVEGDAFGTAPAHGALPGQQAVGGFHGKGLVNTFQNGDKPQGKLTSPTFRIERPFISFLIGGGTHQGTTCINLLVNDKVLRTATGKNNERLGWQSWDVRNLIGQTARIVIVDAHSESWGHINVDQIEFRDTPRDARSGPLDQQPDFGTMALTLIAERDVAASASLPDGELPKALFIEDGLASSDQTEKPFGQQLRGALSKTWRLAPGQTEQVTFVVSWCFPNRPEHGNFYATRFQDAGAVADHIASGHERLAAETRLWHDTYYDATLPHWLLDRLHSTVSTLATGTCQWWSNGRFWAWEGVGCCRGTCGHVWNYAQAVARLFPSLERSVREMQDFSPDGGFIPETGEIRFRGENWRLWAGDSQAGYILKAYREHLCSSDNRFLEQNWPAIRKALQFLIEQDGNADGLIEGKQHNTYDIDFYGANPMIGSLYLAALRAGEDMARERADDTFANTCHRIFSTGRRLMVDKLFNSEYFKQIVDLKEHPKFQHADGCLADQLFGQSWAHQVGLGYVLPEETVRAALQAIWKYDWAPDVAPQNQIHKPERWFAYPGEAGLFTCTWPKSKYLDDGVRYKNEVWTGIEYQVAGHMAWEGLITEALAICRAIHERYHPSKHNPWNEIECGDHYARGMASWSVLIGLSGFEYDGPRGHLGFAPRMTPDNFRSAFTGATGWGTIEQTRNAQLQTNRVLVKWGSLKLKTLTVALPSEKHSKSVAARVNGGDVSASSEQSGQRLTVKFDRPLTLQAAQVLEVEIKTGSGLI